MVDFLSGNLEMIFEWGIPIGYCFPMHPRRVLGWDFRRVLTGIGSSNGLFLKTFVIRINIFQFQEICVLFYMSSLEKYTWRRLSIGPKHVFSGKTLKLASPVESLNAKMTNRCHHGLGISKLIFFIGFPTNPYKKFNITFFSKMSTFCSRPFWIFRLFHGQKRV
jgi:hypothetical protein